MRKINSKKQHGVTMISLTITIIILLILSGVSIVLLTGDNEIIGKSEEAKEKTEVGQYQEKLEILKQLESVNNYTSNEKLFMSNYMQVVKDDEMFRNSKEIALDSARNVLKVVTNEGYKFEITIDEVNYIGN